MSGKKMKSLLDDLDECNKELERFTDKSERLVPYRKETKKTVTNPLSGVRSYAKELYSVLCLGTKCHGLHKAKLQLERRTAPPKGSQSLVSRDNADNPCFTISFLVNQNGPYPNSPSIWQETQIQVVAKETTPKPMPTPLPSHGRKTVGFRLPAPVPPTKSLVLPEIDLKSLQECKDLCSAISKSQIKNPCLGFCLGPEGKLRGVYPVEKRARSITGTIALKDILTSASRSAPTMLKMSRKERMNLAVILASSYLQLQATPWLKDTWSKEDIVFDSDMKTTTIRPCNLEQPYISHEFRAIGPQNNSVPQMANFKTSPLPGNPSLLSLGILLLELYTGQTFEQYSTQASLENGPILNNYIQQLRNLDLVSKWLVTEQEDLSAGYQSAVLHCIRSFFDPDRKSVV